MEILIHHLNRFNMKRSYFNFKRTTVLLLLAFPFLTLVLFSFSLPDASREDAKTKFTGKQLFQGIYFQHGDVVNELSTISKTSLLNSSKELDKGYFELEKRLLQKDPLFFERFKEGVLSHSHITVTETLKKTSAFVFGVMQSMSREGMGKNDASTQESLVNEGTVVVIFVDYPMPAIAFVVPFPPVIYTVAIVLPLGPPTLPLDEKGKKLIDQQSQTKLSGEMLVNEIVTKL
jgi:SdpC family antimicrobial peptide